MGSINKSHNDADGGILLFNGELILLYCDAVNCEVGGKESFKGRVYLTTHRLVVIIAPYRQNASVKSLCAPFCAIVKCSVEQPIFGANYIEATVRDEVDPSKSFSFKLKFSKGGAIELAMAMNRAVQAVGRSYNPSVPPPPAYTPPASAQYYQAPPTVYAPGYNSGIQLPTQQFPDRPPIGFIYASEAPPPYPGLGGNAGGTAQQQFPYGQQQPDQQPGQQNQPPQAGFAQGPGGYPQTAGYPQQQPQGGYPTQQGGGYPPQSQSANYQPPGMYSQQPMGGYPMQPSQQQQQPPYQPPNAPGPGQGPGNSAYPDLSQAGGPPGAGNQQQQPAQQGSWPSAPSYNPSWPEDKKNV